MKHSENKLDMNGGLLNQGFSSLESDRRRLEDAFFLARDKKLIERLRQMRHMKETQAHLAEVSGIRNEKVLEKLVELNVRPETLAALALAPIICVAWADGAIDVKEKQAVLMAVEAIGRHKSDVDTALVDRWLSHKPDCSMIDAWTHYMEGLAGEMDAKSFSALKTEILLHADFVAKASGGILGLGPKISKAEKEVLAKIKKVLE